MYNAKCRHRALSFFAEQSVTSAERSAGIINVQPPMFRNRPKDISVLLQQFLRDNCLETPMLQQRLLNVWEEVAGDTVAKYTEEKTIKNQKLIVKISNSALRADLQMKRTALKDALNKRVGAFIISDIILR